MYSVKHALRTLGLALVLLAACHDGQKSELAEPAASSPDFRFDMVVFDLPLSLAERLSITTDEHDALLGMTIDETQAFEQLEALSKSDARVVRSERPLCNLAPGVHGRIGERAATAAHASASLPGDHLEVDLAPTHTSSWAAVDLDANIVWTSVQGSEFNRFGANAPVPPGYRMKIFCLPAKHPGGGDPPAILALLAITPPTGAVIDANAAPKCEKCKTDKKEQ